MFKYVIGYGLIALLIASCTKEKELQLFRSAATLDTPLHLQLDSTCLHAPNIITPNGDGINDRFQITMGETPPSFSLTITNPNGTVVFTTTGQYGWSGYDAEFNDESGPIPYLYELELMTASGISHQITKVFHVVRDIYSECITADVAPLFGDMLDPRRCDVPYPTHDLVCVE